MSLKTIAQEIRQASKDTESREFKKTKEQAYREARQLGNKTTRHANKAEFNPAPPKENKVVLPASLFKKMTPRQVKALKKRPEELAKLLEKFNQKTASKH